MTLEDKSPLEQKGVKTPVSAEDHESLKYQLLGPSLTKAGQDTVDQQKVLYIL